MKYSKLKQIVNESAKHLTEMACYTGSFDASDASNLLNQLNKFRHSLVVKYDLRPSEYNTLDDIDVGEPEMFSDIIDNYKLKLSKEIINGIEL